MTSAIKLVFSIDSLIEWHLSKITISWCHQKKSLIEKIEIDLCVRNWSNGEKLILVTQFI